MGKFIHFCEVILFFLFFSSYSCSITTNIESGQDSSNTEPCESFVVNILVLEKKVVAFPKYAFDTTRLPQVLFNNNKVDKTYFNIENKKLEVFFGEYESINKLFVSNIQIQNLFDINSNNYKEVNITRNFNEILKFLFDCFETNLIIYSDNCLFSGKITVYTNDFYFSSFLVNFTDSILLTSPTNINKLEGELLLQSVDYTNIFLSTNVLFYINRFSKNTDNYVIYKVNYFKTNKVYYESISITNYLTNVNVISSVIEISNFALWSEVYVNNNFEKKFYKNYTIEIKPSEYFTYDEEVKIINFYPYPITNFLFFTYVPLTNFFTNHRITNEENIFNYIYTSSNNLVYMIADEHSLKEANFELIDNQIKITHKTNETLILIPYKL